MKNLRREVLDDWKEENNMENLGYYNGKYDLIENMTVPMNDRVCYFGDGVYDATYSNNHIIYALDEHIDRFYNILYQRRVKRTIAGFGEKSRLW